MDFDLNPKQRHLIDLAGTLGREKFAPRAARYDAEASFPFENYDDMRDAGLLGLCVPERHGGHGADFATYCLVSAELGRHCGSTALTYNMHTCSMLWSGSMTDDLDMTEAQRARHKKTQEAHFNRVIQDGAIYAQPFSEGNASAAGRAPFGTLATKVDGGYLLTGKKIFASLADAASYFGILCTEDVDDASRKDTIYLAVPKDSDGFEVTGPWDPLGMRGTVSRTLIMEDVFVPEENELMPRGIYFQAANRWPHMFITLAPTYMGLAQAAYDFTVSYLRGEIEGMPPVKRRMYPTKQERMRAWAAQYTIMENANDLARLAIRTCGGQSMLKTLPLERIYRDSRCGSLMLPLTAELCMDRLGREALYEAGEED